MIDNSNILIENRVVLRDRFKPAFHEGPYHIDLNTFKIPYDKNRNYNDPSDPKYLPPYSSYRYNSIYEGVILEMHIVDHCNLKCAGCNHFSPLAKPWYINLESFQEQLELAKENIPSIKFLILLGGEPTLHPQLLELCKIARKVFNNPKEVEIAVFTNGLNLKQVNKDYKEYQKIEVGFSICNYPGQTESEDAKELSKTIGHYSNTRIFMMQTLVNEKGNENPVFNFYNCCRHQLPCLTLKDYKLYICPFAAHLDHYYNFQNKEKPEVPNEDYIDIRDLQGNLDILQTFIFTPKPICRFCHHGGQHWIWHKSKCDLIEFNTELNELYFSDYPRYEYIINVNKDYFLESLDMNKNPSMVYRIYGTHNIEKLEKRYGQGKIDIIIPYYNMPEYQLNQLINTLNSQTIIKDCVIYLISDCSPDEKSVFNNFNSTDLNVIFLKNLNREGPGSARNKGLENSFNKYILMLDADDYFIRNDALEILFNSIQQHSTTKLVSFSMNSDENENKARKTNYLFKRNLIIKNNIKFEKLYYGEDSLFMHQLFYCLTPYEIFEYRNSDIAAYGLNNNNSNLTSEIKNLKEENALNFCRLASSYFWFTELKKQCTNSQKFFEHFDNIIKNFINYKGNLLYQSFLYLYLYQLKNFLPLKFFEKYLDPLTYLEYKNNRIHFTTKNKILSSELDLIKYILEESQTLYNNSFLLKPTINKLKENLLEQIQKEENV